MQTNKPLFASLIARHVTRGISFFPSSLMQNTPYTVNYQVPSFMINPFDPIGPDSTRNRRPKGLVSENGKSSQ